MTLPIKTSALSFGAADTDGATELRAGILQQNVGDGTD
jgi:hypothetical protein